MSLPDNFYTNDTLFDKWLGSTVLQSAPTALGPTSISFPIENLLLGIVIYMMTSYYSSERFGWRHDPLWIKGLASSIMVMAICHTVLLWRWQWLICVSSYGQVHTYLLASYLNSLFPTMFIPALLIQGFFIFKLFLLWRKSFIILILASSLSLLSFAGMVGLFVNGFKVYNLAQVMPNLAVAQGKLLKIALLGATVTNVTITTLIGYHLVQAKTGTGIFYKAVILLVESMMPMTLFCVAVGLNLLVANNIIVVLQVPFVCLSAKLYAISFLFSLNSRQGLVSALEHSNSGEPGLRSKDGHDLGYISVEVEHIVSVITMEKYHPRQGLNRQGYVPEDHKMQPTPPVAAQNHQSGDTLNVIDQEGPEGSLGNGSTARLVKAA